MAGAFTLRHLPSRDPWTCAPGSAGRPANRTARQGSWAARCSLGTRLAITQSPRPLARQISQVLHICLRNGVGEFDITPSGAAADHPDADGSCSFIGVPVSVEVVRGVRTWTTNSSCLQQPEATLPFQVPLPTSALGPYRCRYGARWTTRSLTWRPFRQVSLLASIW